MSNPLSPEERRTLLSKVESGQISASEAIQLLEQGRSVSEASVDQPREDARRASQATGPAAKSAPPGGVDATGSSASSASSTLPNAPTAPSPSIAPVRPASSSRVNLEVDSDLASRPTIHDEREVRARCLRVKVSDSESGDDRVNIRLPIGIIDWGLQRMSDVHPEGRWGELRDLVFNDDGHNIVEVNEGRERIIINVE